MGRVNIDKIKCHRRGCSFRWSLHEGGYPWCRKHAPSRRVKRASLTTEMLEHWLTDLNEWRYPFGEYASINDGRDHIRGAYHVVSHILTMREPKRKKAKP